MCSSDLFRRRAVGASASQEWEQISPLFDCPPQSAADLMFEDHDVESGVSYMYRIVRLSESGEFRFEHFTNTFKCWPNDAACSVLPAE